ncbi:MAG: phenylalanine--tRNA ligase subunit beta [Nitrospirales bacterium]|nr:phenylalanine--tRNA ligase subunit beta [Nitrospira sp.]MDR4500939.1 phenylalanine--tRNA ligase subunit beta [Nitrospirales bacterium]
MPTISIFHKDLERLLHRKTNVNQIESWLPYVKGELKDHNPSTGELRVELQDSNRPDLWCVEGIARQIRIVLDAKPVDYPFLSSKGRSKRRLMVLPGIEKIRPYIAACTATGYEVTEEGLAQLIQTQEKLADIFGRKRQTVSIGVYRLGPISFPITYGLVKSDKTRFTPLGFTEKMTPQEILTVHPKGLEYGADFSEATEVPLLWDKEGQVLSFPPIINSREVGEVQIGDTELLVEVTGTDLPMVLLTLNIFSVNLADRGADIHSIDVTYPYSTEFGKTVKTPIDMSTSQRISLNAIEHALGTPLGSELIEQALHAYGYRVKATRHTLSVKLPAYRNDLMHVMDVAEDVAISRGYESFSPIMPAQFTVGALSISEKFSDQIRDLMIGFGFQEIFSNILASKTDLIERMRIGGTEHGHVVEIENAMTESYACLRSSILPFLLRVEAASPRSFYPHQLFEIGEVAVPDMGVDLGARTVSKIAAIIAQPGASFSDIHSYLDLLMYYLVRDYRLEPSNHGSFLDGRVGRILCEENAVGFIGELHPEVLEAWQIHMPIAAFEFQISRRA